MWPGFILSNNKEADTIRSTTIFLSVDLRLCKDRKKKQLLCQLMCQVEPSTEVTLLSAIALTSRFTGICRLKSILEDIACCRIKLLYHSSVSFDFLSQRETCYIPQHTSIGRQSSNRNSDVVVNPKHLLLVRCKLSC